MRTASSGVTTPAAAWLDGKHTVFGQIASGMDTIDKIEATETDGRDRPVEPVLIESISISE